MNNSSKAGLLDKDIVAATATIQQIIQNNGSFAELDEAQDRLAQIIRDKRAFLYEPKDPSYFIDSVFSEATPEDRQKKAAELEEEVLELLISINNVGSEEFYNQVPFSELLVDTLDFLRFFKNRATGDAPQKSFIGISQPQEIEHIPLEWGFPRKIGPEDFCSCLENNGYLSSNNAALLQAILEGHRPPKEAKLSVDWQGSKESLVTCLIMSYELNILNRDSIRRINRALPDGTRTPVPTYSSLLVDYFSVNGSKLTMTNVSREYVDPLLSELQVFRERVTEYYWSRGHGKKGEADLRWDDIISTFIIGFAKSPDTQAIISEGLTHIDRKPLELLNTLLGDLGED